MYDGVRIEITEGQGRGSTYVVWIPLTEGKRLVTTIDEAKQFLLESIADDVVRKVPKS